MFAAEPANNVVNSLPPGLFPPCTFHDVIFLPTTLRTKILNDVITIPLGYCIYIQGVASLALDTHPEPLEAELGVTTSLVNARQALVWPTDMDEATDT